MAGDPAGLAVAYDRYAPQLYAYSRSILREPADAADVVQDTFLIAASRLSDLREPDQLRAWLYAVARNACLRKIRAEKVAAASYPAASTVADAEAGEVGGRAELAELRALVHDAIAGLTDRDREVLVLRLWQGINGAEAARVLGVSRDYADALFARARSQLEVCIGVLLVARSGRQDCKSLDALLDGWDGQLTVLLRKRLHRHIARCTNCSERRRRELVPALLGLSAGAAIAGAAAADAARHTAHVPAALKDAILTAATGHTAPPAAAAAAATSGALAGWPKPRLGRARRLAHAVRPVPAAAGGVAAAAAAGIALALTLSGGAHPGRPANGGTSGATGPGASDTAPGASPGLSAPGSSGPGGSAGGRNGAAGSRISQAAFQGQASPGSGVLDVGAPPASAPRPTSGSSAAPSGGSSAPTSGSSGQPSSGPPSSQPPSSQPPSKPPPTHSPPAQGTLSVASPVTLILGKGTLTLTANGGPVTWSISEPSSLIGQLTLSAKSGTLAAGASTQVTLSVSGLLSVGTTLTVLPGEHPVLVLLGAG